MRDLLRYLWHYYIWMLKHPLNRGHPVRTLARYLAWHLGCRLLRYPVLYPFVNDLQLAIGAGDRGATSVVYFGLEEYEDMAFCAHCLRPGELFVDVGACFGTYSLLAASAAGAEVMAFEPNPVTAERLLDNVRLNRMESAIDVRQAAVGAEAGSVWMTTQYTAANHIVRAEDMDADKRVSVPLTTLDEEVAGQNPVLMKIDAEGYEQFVVDGASRLLGEQSLLAVLVEEVELHTRYDAGADIHEHMLAHGFRSYRYAPETRRLEDLDGARNQYSYNTLYVRDVAQVEDRVRTASAFTIHGQSV